MLHQVRKFVSTNFYNALSNLSINDQRRVSVWDTGPDVGCIESDMLSLVFELELWPLITETTDQILKKSGYSIELWSNYLGHKSN